MKRVRFEKGCTNETKISFTHGPAVFLLILLHVHERVVVEIAVKLDARVETLSSGGLGQKEDDRATGQWMYPVVVILIQQRMPEEESCCPNRKKVVSFGSRSCAHLDNLPLS